MDWAIYAVEGLFLVLFLATLWRYLLHRDPVTRDLVLIFSGLAVGFVAEAWESATGSASPVLTGFFAILLIAQPVALLHLVSLVRPVSRVLIWGTAAALVAGTVPMFLLPTIAPGTIGPRTVAVFIVVAVFVVAEAAAAIYLLVEAVRRTGPLAVRMGLAAISTGIFASALVVSTVGSVAGAPADVSRAFALALAFVAGLGYIFAFLTPAPIQRILHAHTTVEYTNELIARSDASVQEIWAGFVAMAVRMQGDSAAMLTGPRTGLITLTAASGIGDLTNVDPITWEEFDSRVAGSGRWDVPVEKAGPLRRQLAEAAGARFVSVVPVDLPASDERGALVLLSSHRSLFHPSDGALLSSLGAQTAVVAERRAVVAEQEDLSARLASTVEALRSASAAKSDFVASMSHEFRTPLSAIIGFSDLMASEPRTGDHVTVPVEWVDHIRRGGQHLLALVNDVLDLSKIEAGRLDIDPEPVDVLHAVTEAVNGLRPLADRRNLAMEIEVARAIVTVDRGRLRQILYNLISNAIKYTPDGGSIRVVSEAAGPEFRISVVDTGVGIAPEDHARVFEEFQQVGDPSERQPGSGLGLAVTKRLAEAHGGRIELESARGKGSTFTLVLPASDAERATEPETLPPAGLEPASTGDILVIEDDPSAVRLLREYLEGAGYSVRVAPSGESGISAAIAERPAAIVLDVLLPGIDGWEVLRRLKADARVQDVPVVIVTVVEEREVGLALGAVDYLVKPIDRGALLACLARYVRTNGGRAGPRRVLVVDDEPGALALIKGALEPEGVEVITAEGGREALEWARSGELVDLIVCDLVMPDVDGFEVIRALKGNERTSSLPIVVCTAHDLTTDEKAKLNGHILGIVAKGQNARAGLLDWLKHAVPTAAA